MGLQGTKGARLLYQGRAKKDQVVGNGNLVGKGEVVLELWSYPVEDGSGKPRRSFEAYLNGETAQRFLNLDHGAYAFDLALSFCYGVRAGLDLEPRTLPEFKVARSEFLQRLVRPRD